MRNIVLLMMSFSFFQVCAVPASAWIISAPENYGRVIIKNFSLEAGLQPVRFDHWLHRSLYTCRLCHVDVGFAMEANGTKITADANSRGLYCGACHDGARTHKLKKIFPSCSKGEVKWED